MQQASFGKKSTGVQHSMYIQLIQLYYRHLCVCMCVSQLNIFAQTN